MSETEKEFKLTRFNRYLASHSWLEWLDFIDKMREEHYIFLWPGKALTSVQEEAYKYKKLKDLLKIKKGWLIADHNHIIEEMLRRDFLLFNMAKDYPSNQVYATPFVPDYSELEKTKRYIGVHGAEYKSLPHINVTPWSWDTINTDRLYLLLGYPTPSGVIFHELCDLYALYNGILTPVLAYCSTVGKVYYNHNGVTPTGEYREYSNPKDYVFGNWQDVGRDSYGTLKANRTCNFQLRINYTPDFDAPYRLIMVGFTWNSREFNGLGVAEFANRWNVFYDSGPVRGTCISPLIGTDQFYTCKNPEAIKPNTSDTVGWKVSTVRFFILPPEGHFSCDYVPEEEREEWASYMVKRLHKKFPKCYPAITQEENQ